MLLNIFISITNYYLLEDLFSTKIISFLPFFNSPSEVLLRLIFLKIIPNFILLIYIHISIFKNKDKNIDDSLLTN